MMNASVKTLAPEQIRHLVEMAEQTRAAMSRFAGYEVSYDATALQLLDEWIDRHVQQFSEPSQRMRLLWTSFLGEMFRRHHGGEWAFLGRRKQGELIVLCPKEFSGVHEVDVSGQVERRIAEGISASLTYSYSMTCIKLKAEQ